MEEPEFEIYNELVRAVIPKPLTEDEAIMWMALLHTHEIHLRIEPKAMDDTDEHIFGRDYLPPLTQRGAADVIAEIWPDREDNKRCYYAYWYNEFIDKSKSRFEVVDGMPEDVQRKVEQLRQLLETHPLVLSVIEED